MPLRVVIAGGGTGGHVIPGLAIARELRDQDQAECLFIGTPRGLENRLVPEAGFPLHVVRIGQLKNVSAMTRVKTLADLPISIVHCIRLLRGWNPDALISVGGYASGPAALAAILLRVPVVAFEPNVVAGFANRMIAPFVSAACVQFAATAKLFRNAEITGVPIRQEFFEIAPMSDTSSPNLLVFGGSQGARAINSAVLAALPLLEKQLPQLRIVHQTGPTDVAASRNAYAALSPGTRIATSEVLEFIHDMPRRMEEAHLVICRAGASTTAELAAARRPAIFVPLPTASDDHQTKNAEGLARAGAAIILPQSQLTPDSLARAILDLFASPARMREIAAKTQAFAHPGAAKRIAEIVVSVARRR